MTEFDKLKDKAIAVLKKSKTWEAQSEIERLNKLSEEIDSTGCMCVFSYRLDEVRNFKKILPYTLQNKKLLEEYEQTIRDRDWESC